MTNYIRITAYYPQKDFSVIMDSNGKYEKKWQFSAMLVSKGFKIISIQEAGQFDYGDMVSIAPNNTQFALRAIAHGEPKRLGNNITVADKTYSLEV